MDQEQLIALIQWILSWITGYIRWFLAPYLG